VHLDTNTYGPYFYADEAARIQKELTQIAAWSAEHDLVLNRNRNRNGVPVHLLSPSTIPCQPPTFSWELDTFYCPKYCYLGVTLSNNLTWSAHNDQLFIRSVRLSYFITRLCSLFPLKYVIDRLCHSHSAVQFAGDFSRFIAERLRKFCRALRLLSRYFGCKRPQYGVVLFPHRGTPF